ncbi:MAG: sigma 54-interacting transcriptional regulator [Anaerovorax sp.]|nr:sigma 54-interacting transcriptional regulator [Anaerovorax sp.]
MLSIGDLILNSLDYVLIVDRNYNIAFNTRYDEKTNTPISNIKNGFINRNFFEAYPNLKREDSSVVKCMETGEIVVCKNQTYQDYLGRVRTTNNVTVPILRGDRIVGVVELVKDVARLENIESQKADIDFDRLVEKIQKESGLITFDSIMTKNKEMLKNIEIGKVLAKLPNPTLIYGETGTGKELFAQSIIHYSGVKKSKVVVLNCATVPENLVESILFGTKRGIYTGAENRVGLFEEADGGILFLDELNSMPYHIQAKLLRVIQDGTFRSLGDNKDKYVDVKLIGAMNIDPIIAMENNQFRKDLFYRFSSSMIRLAPLRERKEDIDLFIEYYIKYFGDLYGKKIRGITRDLRKIMMEYSWEGNVRELKNTIELMIEFADNNVLLSEEHLPKYLQQRIGKTYPNLFENKKEKQDLIEKEIIKEISGSIEEKTKDGAISFTDIINEVEKNLIQSVLDKCDGNKSKAAKMLMLPRQTLKYKLKKLDIQ